MLGKQIFLNLKLGSIHCCARFDILPDIMCYHTIDNFDTNSTIIYVQKPFWTIKGPMERKGAGTKV